MGHFKGKAGNVYVEQSDTVDKKWEAWFEDFYILGVGDSELEALQDAASHTADIGELIDEAVRKTGAGLIDVYLRW